MTPATRLHHSRLLGSPGVTRRALPAVVALLLCAWGAASPRALYAQQPAAAATSGVDSVAAYARAYSAIARIRDRAQGELAEPRNKKAEVQGELRGKVLAEIAQVLTAEGLTQAQYDHLTHAVSVDPEARRQFEAALAQLAVPKR
ncbi:MAG: DUF4168 domain-containing protein [Gemmatimonadaceae bacterium]